MFAALEREIRQAIAANDADLLARKVQQVRGLGTRVIFRQPGFWIARFQFLEKKVGLMSDQARAEEYLRIGRGALQNDQLDRLKAAVQQLEDLLPVGTADRGKSISDVMC